MDISCSRNHKGWKTSWTYSMIIAIMKQQKHKKIQGKDKVIISGKIL